MSEIIKTALWIAGLIFIACMVIDAIFKGKLILSNTQLTALKLEHEHKEKMADKFIQYHRQAYGSPHSYVSYPHDSIKPNT
ncbi:MAG: hypothetical protein RH948_11945 [Cyclobacteriaceae bacterium]